MSGKRGAASTISNPLTKQARTNRGISVGHSRFRPDTVLSTTAPPEDDTRSQFLSILSSATNGVSNKDLKSKFGNEKYLELVPIINELMKDARLTMSRSGDDLIYHLVSEEMAEKFSGLDMSARLVYQVIEKAGNVGIWTRDVRTQTNIQQQALTKIFKTLENRKLIKPCKAVANKSKKLYMLYNLTPSKEITGGPWYTELEFDHEFISELRNFVLMCVQRMNSGKGVTLPEVCEKMKQARISRVELNPEEVQQIMQTLAYDYKIEQSGQNPKGDALFIEAKKVTCMCEFQWWEEVLSSDFHFRKIKFEDGVELSAHELHHHS